MWFKGKNEKTSCNEIIVSVLNKSMSVDCIQQMICRHVGFSVFILKKIKPDFWHLQPLDFGKFLFIAKEIFHHSSFKTSLMALKVQICTLIICYCFCLIIHWRFEGKIDILKSRKMYPWWYHASNKENINRKLYGFHTY